jgi:hypothetical protein
MMRRVMTVLVFALVSVALVPAPSSAQAAAPGSVAGRVEAPSGVPIAGVRVLAYTDADTWVGTGTVTGADGSYELGGLAPGSYRLLFHGEALGYVSEWSDDSPTRAAARELTVPTGGSLDGVDATLAPGGTVSGTVTRLGGEPIGGVAVWAYLDRDRWVGTVATRTADDGTYQLRGLPTGEHRLRFVAPAGSGLASEWWDDQALRSTATTVSVTPSTALTGIDPELGLPVPPGEPPVRYRDPIFPEVVTTSPSPTPTSGPARAPTSRCEPTSTSPRGTRRSPGRHDLRVRRELPLREQDLARAGRPGALPASRGYVVVSIDYRLSPTGCGADAECGLAIADARADAQTAVRWLRANAATTAWTLIGSPSRDVGGRDHRAERRLPR